MKKRIIDIVCALVFIAGLVITATDGIVAVFGCARGWQYLFNLLFIFGAVPACIAACDLPRRLRPELYGQDE
jgi:hypothetical protein